MAEIGIMVGICTSP